MKDVKFTARVLSVDASHFNRDVKLHLSPDSTEAAFNAFAQNADEYEITVHPIPPPFKPGYYRLTGRRPSGSTTPRLISWHDTPPWGNVGAHAQEYWERVEVTAVGV